MEKNLYDSLVEIANLPAQYVDRKNEQRKLVDARMKTSQPLAEVVAGRTSFTKMAEPLFDANKNFKIPFGYFLGRRAPVSKDFLQIAADAEKNFEGIMPLEEWYVRPRGGNVINLTRPPEKTNPLIYLPAGFVFVVSIIIFFVDNLITRPTHLDFTPLWVGLFVELSVVLMTVVSLSDNENLRSPSVDAVRKRVEDLDKCLRNLYPLDDGDGKGEI